MNPAAGLNPGLRERLAQINSEIAEKNTLAQSKWAAFENLKTKVSNGKTGAGEAKAAEAAHLDYMSVAGEVKQLEEVQQSIFREIAGTSATDGADPQSKATAWSGKSVGARAAESFEMKELLRSGVLNSDRAHFQAKLGEISPVELKSLITGVSDASGGAFITNQRVGYVGQPQRPTSILDLVTIGQASTDAVEYARQTTWTNTAVEVAEATSLTTGTKPEATLGFEKVIANVVTLAHWVRTTRRALADVNQLQSLIDSQLQYGLRLRLENQMVNGDGTGENFTGILNTSGILTQAKGSDSVIDALQKAITQLRLGYIEPSGIALHPNDAEVVRLTKDTNGQYLLGSPGEIGSQTLWGIPVVVTTAIPDDTAIVGDFRHGGLWIREAAQLLASDSDGDQFTHNIITVLCEMRAAWSVLLPAAFCKVTSVD